MARGIQDPDESLAAGARGELPLDPDARCLRDGAREELGELLNRMAPRLHNVALRITRDGEGAREAVQNAFEKVLRHRGRFRAQARVSTWVHRIAVNEALMWLRSQRVRGRYTTSDEPGVERPDPSPDPLDRLLHRERIEALHEGLAALRESERQVLVDCALEERGYEEWGREWGIAAAAVKSRAFRARAQLREALAGVRPGCETG